MTLVLFIVIAELELVRSPFLDRWHAASGISLKKCITVGIRANWPHTR